MGVKTVFFVILAFFASFLVNAQNNVKMHTVQQGETVYSIAKNYGISEQELIKYNPDIATNLPLGAVLVIPSQQAPAVQSTSENFTWHTVQPKETVYGICKQYGITQAQLLAHNPEVKDGLQIGMRLKIPSFNTVQNKAENPQQDLQASVESRDSSKFVYHLVEPKETVFSIAKAAGISQEEFLKLNPHVRENGLQIGQTVKWPKATMSAKEEVPKDQNEPKKFGLYRILPGDDLVKIAAKYSTTVEELIRLNPELKDGVIVGRYIVVPEKRTIQQEVVALEGDEKMFWYIPGQKAKPKLHFAVMLPLFLSENDSIEVQELSGDHQIYAPSKLSLQYLTGFKVAMDTLAGLGYDINFEVFDTRNDLDQIRKIVRNIDRSVDAIFGPLYAKNAELVAQMLPDVPVISPLSKALNNQNLPNLINAVASPQSELLVMANFINKKSSTSKVVFINTDIAENHSKMGKLQQYLFATDSARFQEIWVDEEYEQLKYLNAHLNANTLVVVLDDDAALISDLLTKLENKKDTTLCVLASSKLFELNTLEYRYVNNKQIVAPAIEYTNYADSTIQQIVESFRAASMTDPDKFGWAGFDTGLYFAQLAATGKLSKMNEWPHFSAASRGYYFQKVGNGGPVNNFMFLLRIRNFSYTPVN